MPVQWSSLSPEVMVSLDRDAAESLGSQLQARLRSAVRSGRLSAGERLPSSRQMAGDLGVSRGLVQDAYEQLVAEGYLIASPGAATRVATTPQVHVTSQVAAGERARMEIDFTPGRPDLNSFPMQDWLWAGGEAARSASALDIGYGDAAGSPRLREVIASYVQRVRGADARPGDVVISAGFTQGLALTLATLRALGVERVAVEDPGHLEMHDAVRNCGMETEPIPVDDRGLVVTALRETSARAVLVTPAHQTPTGVVLSPERRQELLRWVEDRDAYVIEDEYDSEFRYDRQPVGSLQGLAPQRVVGIGSVSKSLGPCLRLGWVLAPERLAAAIAEQKDRADRGSPGLDQMALARLIESGRFDRHLRRMRKIYAQRRATLVDALATHAPHLQLSGLSAGFHAVAALPDEADEQAVVAAAAARSVGLQGMSRYRSDHAVGPPAIVLGFGDVNGPAIQRGVATVADLL